MKFLLCLAAILVLAAAIPITDSDTDAFLYFQKTYNKTYSSPAEYQMRFNVFKANMVRARQNQVKNPLARFGVTKFSDLTPAEFASFYLGSYPVPIKAEYKNFAVTRPPHAIFNDPSVQAPNPTSYDWGSAGVVTPVYNQGQCGSCWAFSATEAIESYWALAGKGLVQLSMEQIVDCDTTCYGCGGGWPYLAYQYVQQQGGIDSYSSYPYTAEGGTAGSCQYSAANVVGEVTGYQQISGEAGLYSQLSSASGGPVSVCVDASSWSGYQGGILTTCGNSVDHCVEATGYMQYGSSGAYWNVRNSWGTDWGETGYIWIAIGQDLCSIGDYATIPNV